MPLKIPPAFSGAYAERDGIVDLEGDEDRLPIHIAGPIVVALSLSLWGAIGFLVSALL